MRPPRSARGRRRSGAGIVLVALIGAGATPVAAAEPAPSPFTVTVTAPDTYTERAGVVDVVFTVVSDGTAVPSTAVVTIDDKEAHLNYGIQHRMVRTVALPPECAVTCTQTVSFDTAAWVDPGPDPLAEDPTLAERKDQRARVEIYAAAGESVTPAAGYSSLFVVDNHRHRLFWSGTDAPVNTVWKLRFPDPAEIAIHYPMRGAVTTKLERIEISLPGHGDVLAPITVRGPVAPGVYGWGADIDTRALPDGVWTARIVGFDERGVPTNMLRQQLVVDHGPKITAELLPGAQPDPNSVNGRTVRVSIAKPMFANTLVNQVRIYVDDQEIPAADACWCGHGDPWTTTREFVLHGSATAGPHTLRVAVKGTQYTYPVPNQDWSGAVTVPIDVSPGPAITTALSGQVVSDGGSALDVAAAAAPGTTLRSWTAKDVAGATIAGGDLCAAAPCPTQTSMSVPLGSLQPGHQSVHVSVTDSLGTTASVRHDLAVHTPTTMSLTVPAQAKAGQSVIWQGYLKTPKGQPIEAAAIILQRRLPGGSAWQEVQRVQTSGTGHYLLVRIADRNATWRVMSANTEIATYPVVSSSSVEHFIGVEPKLAIRRLPKTVEAGGNVRFVVASSPSSGGDRIKVQVRRGDGSWRLVARPRLAKNGSAAVSINLGGPGKWTVRVVRAATTEFVGARVAASVRAH